MAIRRFFFNPPIAIARLGASPIPVDAYTWEARNDPHVAGETGVVPSWTLDVQPDGSVVPRLPQALVFRDGNAIRPVAPFLELWASIDADNGAARELPVSEALLNEHGLELDQLSFRIDARNRKAARRADDENLVFGTFPALEVAATDHAVRELAGESPPSAGAEPMIPNGRGIALGRFQVIRPSPQPAAEQAVWARQVDVSTLRVRFTPPRGLVYGPPAAVGRGAVEPAQAFLNPRAGWFNHDINSGIPRVQPADTVDFLTQGRSLGVVDDTSDVVIELLVAGSVRCHANLFVAPPDFAPDRRPFVSLADGLLDREAPRAPLAGADLDAWVEDLFERVFETVSLFNVDAYRNGLAKTLEPDERRAQPIDEGLTQKERAMGSLDALRSDQPIAAASEVDPLPLTQRARQQHRFLSDLVTLKGFVLEHPERLRDLIRAPFREDGVDGRSTMRMPPFMRGSNAGSLTLMRWQYELVMRWVEALIAAPPPELRRVNDMQARAAARRAEVLNRRPLGI